MEIEEISIAEPQSKDGEWEMLGFRIQSLEKMDGKGISNQMQIET